jgi:hypothetical protein
MGATWFWRARVYWVTAWELSEILVLFTEKGEGGG